MAKRNKRYKVLVLFGSAGTPPANQDFSKELKTEDFAAEAHVIEALKTVGHEVRTLGVWDEASLIVDEIKANPPDVVFNLTEHFNEISAYDRNVAGLLEMMAVPYTGSSPTGLTLCKNKGMAKELLAYHKIRVPNFAIYSPGATIKRPSRALPQRHRPTHRQHLQSRLSRPAHPRLWPYRSARNPGGGNRRPRSQSEPQPRP